LSIAYCQLPFAVDFSTFIPKQEKSANLECIYCENCIYTRFIIAPEALGTKKMPAFLFAVPIARKKSRHKKFTHSPNQQRLNNFRAA
jgi:hypothetical protein